MRLRFAPRAALDLGEIGDYLRARSPSGAVRVQKAIFNSVQVLIQFPLAGRAQQFEGVRKMAVRNYPYLVYYRLDALAEEIVIIAIQHASRERPFHDA
jgi:plasmid stabilization system protein ParE